MESKGPGLYEFLIEAELEHYYNSIKNDLKIQNTSQLKYVTEEDLYQLGMSKPEMRRLKKYFNKYYPQNYLSKFKKMLLPNKNDQKLNGWQGVGGSGIGPPSEEGRCGAANERIEPHRMPNKHIISAESIVVNKELGMGEFGVVQQGVWTNDGDRIQVAIKCLSRERMQSNPIEFLKEAAIMHSIDHEHIVRLYGVVLDTDSLMLVTELAPLRSLLECLKEPSLRASFPVLTLCDFALQICDGMQYLENKRLIHRDLAARNILVFSKNKVKISDFGLSRALGQGKDYYQTNFNVHLKLPIAWCAPECISYLRFTSASDVWAYGVTLWEMFSYGFQPWAALTGHQILEAIDEPNYQRLEQPECCPREYYGVMNRCWTHDPVKRPKFSELAAMLPECRPEQVQAVAESEPGPSRKDKLQHRVGDIITVLDKGAVTSAGGSAMWKGVLANGKTGLFDPAHTVAYIGTNLPSAPNRPTDTFSRSESKYSSTRRKLRSEMISAPQGDLKHTGHVGLDGAYFGDLFYFGYNHLPRQVVAPYKPHEDLDQTPLLQATAGGGLPSLPQPLTNLPSAVTPGSTSLHASDHIALSARQLEQLTPPECWPPQPTLQTDHEYHEISDEENLVADSPRSEKTFDFGPSLLDEMETMFRNLKSPLPGTPASPLDHDGVNKCNELRELTSRLGHKKKQAAVKPISAHDQKILDSAIELATELTARSMNDLESEPLPTTPMSPNKRKFSFRFPNTGGASDADGGKNERRNFSEEAQSIPDLQSTLTEEAELAYKSLVEVPTPEVAINNHMMCSDNPLRMLKSGNISVIKPRIKTKLKPVKKPSAESVECIDDDDEVFVDGKEMVSKERRQGQKNSSVSSETCVPPPSYTECRSEDNNPIPLPPRDRSKMTSVSKRHTRKHPLIIPASSIQRTLNKVNVITPEDISTNNSIRGFDFSQNRVKIVPDGKMATEPAYINHNPFKQQIEDTDFDTQSLHFEEQIDSNLAALDELEETSQEFGDSFKQRNLFLNDENMKSTQHRIDTARLKKNFLESAERKNGGDFECKKQGESVLTDNEALLRHATDHVSCEDLLEFADTKPSPRARGLESDQVRIMSKVLGTEISAEQCLLALEHSNWDVHKAIKLTKLQNILKTEHPFVDLGLCNGALAANQWDLNRAANWVVAANQDGDITQV